MYLLLFFAGTVLFARCERMSTEGEQSEKILFYVFTHLGNYMFQSKIVSSMKIVLLMNATTIFYNFYSIYFLNISNRFWNIHSGKMNICE